MQPSEQMFKGLGAVYRAARPGYAAVIFAALAPRGGSAVVATTSGDACGDRVVVDVGCGTGIGTRGLAEAGWTRVIGLDPVSDMLAAAAAEPAADGAGPIEYRLGTANDPGIEAATADLVTCFQSYHWFEGPAALATFHRMLRPGGRLALVWNVRVGGDPLSDRWIELVAEARAAARRAGFVSPPDRSGDPELDGLFDVTERIVADHPHVMDEAAAVERFASASYCHHAGPARSGILDAVRRTVRDHADADGRITLGQESQLTLAVRRPDPASPE